MATAVSNTNREVGTDLYKSPEVRSGKVTAKIDVWAYGIVMLEIITGLKPFDSDRENPDLVSHFLYELTENWKPKEYLEPEFDEKLVEIIQDGCLINNIKKRWSMEEVLQKLK